MSGIQSSGHFQREVDDRNIVVRHDSLVMRDHERFLAFAISLHLPLVGEVENQNVGRGIRLSCFADDAFHRLHPLVVESILGGVIDSELDEKQIHRALRQDIVIKAEDSEGRVRATNARVIELEFCFGKTGAQILFD